MNLSFYQLLIMTLTIMKAITIMMILSDLLHLRVKKCDRYWVHVIKVKFYNRF